MITVLLPAMLDSTTTPYLSLADDTADTEPRYSVVNKSGLSKKSTSSFASCYEEPGGGARVERLEREVTVLAGKLDSEIQHRRRLQEILAQSGISLPAELGLQE